MLRLGEKRMLRKFVALGLVGLFLAMSLVVAEDSIGPYNPVADVNRDGIVDILDLVEVGQAYGSNYTLMHQTNKTTVTVLSYENNNFSYVENALVAVFSQSDIMEGQWNYTNSSGVVDFDLNANSSYIAIAWDSDRFRYNYANFTTNSLGEASATIWLSYYPKSSMRSIPKGWIVITFLNNATSKPYTSEHIEIYAIEIYNSTNDGWSTSEWYLGPTHTGILAMDCQKYAHSCPYTKPNVVFKAWYFAWPSYRSRYSVYHTDEYGGIYAVEIIEWN